MRFKFCPHCGSKAELREIGDEGLMPFCASCSMPLFDMFSSCVLCVVINEENEAALIKQSYVSDKYVGVAGYIKGGESAEQAAKREVEEELGIKAIRTDYLESFWYEKKELLMLGFAVFVEKADFKISAEVDSADWFPLDLAKERVRENSTIYKLLCLAEKKRGTFYEH